jgi:hypothetical protein
MASKPSSSTRRVTAAWRPDRHRQPGARSAQRCRLLGRARAGSGADRVERLDNRPAKLLFDPAAPSAPSTAFSAVSAARSARVRGPREFATETSWPSAVRRRANVPPMFPAPMIPIFRPSSSALGPHAGSSEHGAAGIPPTSRHVCRVVHRRPQDGRRFPRNARDRERIALGCRPGTARTIEPLAGEREHRAVLQGTRAGASPRRDNGSVARGPDSRREAARAKPAEPARTRRHGNAGASSSPLRSDRVELAASAGSERSSWRPSTGWRGRICTRSISRARRSFSATGPGEG